MVFNLFQHSTLYPLCRCGQGRDYLRDELVKAACAAHLHSTFERARGNELRDEWRLSSNCFNACCLPLLAVVIAFKTFMCFSLACYTQFARLGVPGPIYLHTHSIIFFFLAGYLFSWAWMSNRRWSWLTVTRCVQLKPSAVQYSDCTAFGNRESPFEFPDEWLRTNSTSVCSYSSHPSRVIHLFWQSLMSEQQFETFYQVGCTQHFPMHYPTCFPLPTNWSGLSYQSKGFVSVEHCWIVSLLVILEMSNAAATHTWRKEVKSDRRNSAVELRYVEVARNVRE